VFWVEKSISQNLGISFVFGDFFLHRFIARHILCTSVVVLLCKQLRLPLSVIFDYVRVQVPGALYLIPQQGVVNLQQKPHSLS
jgi:hypothetical protein